MRVLITGICGFVGSTLASCLLESIEDLHLVGIDNLMRPGSETNRQRVEQMGVQFIHGDLRHASDLAQLPACDWVIDAAANPSVLAGLSADSSSRSLVEHNLLGSLNVLEYCRQHCAGLLLLSSSRVYSIAALNAIPLVVQGAAFALDTKAHLPVGLTDHGIGSEFSTTAPVSLYGSTKLASETVALEYGSAFDFPVWVTRCGVLAGAGQFGTAAQGIFTFWINAHLRRRPLRFIGFQGSGHQTRDAFHPRDLTSLLVAQMRTARRGGQRIYTAGGGQSRTMSLANLQAWCDDRFGRHAPTIESAPRAFDAPWVVMNNSDAMRDFAWQPHIPMSRLLDEIAEHAEHHPQWLELSGA
jgi:CDP-paratose 2-epimerase